MPRLVISTVGTSLLYKQIDSQNTDESDWGNILSNYANSKFYEIPDEVKAIIKTLKDRAIDTLNQADIKTLRKVSAELNGIYGLYNNQIENGIQDFHWLIATDTAQGETTANIVKSFLENKKLIVNTYQPYQLSTLNTQKFNEGIDKLLNWLDEDIIPNYQEAGYTISFNLVSGFKSLQAYLNTFGMFYADEMIYIFEGENSELIRIPRLPIQIDYSGISPVKFALMEGGNWLPRSEVDDVPEALIFPVDNEVTLSEWGNLIWKQGKEDLLSNELLPFPRLKYQNSFIHDYQKINQNKEKVKLQEVLAKVSSLLKRNNGDTASLKQDGGLLYDIYTNKRGIAHFRVTQGLRVSCIPDEQGNLILRRYGNEPDVNQNP